MTEEEILALAAEFSRRISLDPEMRAMMRKVQKKTADFGDTSQMFLRRAELLRNYLQGIVTDLPEGAREQLCTALLNEGYTETNEVMKSVQTALDEPQGIHLNPVQPKRPDERIAQVAHSLEDPTVPPEKIVRRAGAPVANVSMSFHDDFIRENAETRAKLGLNPVISRYGTDCCEWCSSVAGRYKFGEQPKDIFRRHDNCDCTIVYDTKVLRGKTSADGRRSRTWEEVKPEEVLAAAPEPKVFTKEEARRLEENKLSELTKPGQGDIIGRRETQFIPANTISEAEEYGKKFADTVNYSGLSLDNVNAINETLTELHELYPTKELKIIKSNSKLTDASARSSFESLSINPLIGTIGRSPEERKSEIINSLKIWKTAREKATGSLLKKCNKTIKDLEESLKYDRWNVSGGTSTKKTITHEYGHIIADQYFGQINYKLANPNCYSEEGVKLRKLVNDTYRKAKSTGDIYNISEYASTDSEEFFAETFAMYHLGEELPEYIRDMVKGVLEHGAV